MSARGLEATGITMERGWKLTTAIAKFNTGFKCRAFSVDNPADLVAKTIRFARDPLYEEELIQQINVVGHGSASGIQIGGHFVEAGNFDDYTGEFQKLRQVLSGESFVFLRGCAVGQNEKLLVRFAKAFGVPVYAGTSAENVLLDFNFGDIKVAMPGGWVYDASRP